MCVSLAGAAVGEPGDRKEHIPRDCFFPSLDSDQKDQLIEVIEKLLADKTTVGIMGRKDKWWDRFLCSSHSCALSHILFLASPAGGRQRSDGL